LLLLAAMVQVVVAAVTAVVLLADDDHDDRHPWSLLLYFWSVAASWDGNTSWVGTRRGRPVQWQTASTQYPQHVPVPDVRCELNTSGRGQT
jgi:hypothetical protein